MSKRPGLGMPEAPQNVNFESVDALGDEAKQGSPKVPHTSLFHTFVRGEADIVLEEALKISADTGVALFGWARGTDMPGHCWFEWQIGDAAEEIEDGEVAELFQRLMDAVDARMAEREAGESEEAGR